jgi:sec-independent protein translocase protein TatA
MNLGGGGANMEGVVETEEGPTGRLARRTNGMGLENPLHLLLILVVVLMVFGVKKLPEMGRSLGEGMRSFRDGIKGDESKPDELPASTSPPEA